MVNKKILISQEAAFGERMIQINVRLWTNKISGKEGRIVPKHAWSSGVVRMEANEPHGIKPMPPVNFHTLMDLPAVIEKVLIANGIILHKSRRTRKYFAEE